MNILMISDVYFPRINGVSTSIQTFRDTLGSDGIQVTLVAPDYPEATGPADVIRIPSRKVPLDPEDRLMRRSDLARLETSRDRSAAADQGLPAGRHLCPRRS